MIEDEITQVTEVPQRLMEAARDQLVGDIQIGRLIGQGQSSQIYLGQNLFANKACAVKIFRPELLLRPVQRGRFLRTARELAALDHPRIARTYGLDQATDGRWYATMDAVGGRSLKELLQLQGTMSRRSLLPILRELCLVLAAAHGAGLVHLRLHAGNVMVDWHENRAAPSVTLLDFGVRHLHPAPRDTVVPARPARDAIFVSPEQIKGEPLDSRSDVYALAALSYELLSGRPPFLHETYSETIEHALVDVVVPLSQQGSVPPEVEETVMRGLERDPKRRVPSVEAFLSSIDPLSVTGGHQVLLRTPSGRHRQATGALPGIPVDEFGAITAQPTKTRAAHGTDDGDFASGVVAPPAADRRRKPVLLLVLVASALLCLGALAWLLLSGDDDPKRRAGQGSGQARQRRSRPSVDRRPSQAVPSQPGATANPAPLLPSPARPISPPTAQPAQPALARPTRTAGLPITKPAGFGTLNIRTTNNSAIILIDGRQVGRGLRHSFPQLEARMHRVQVKIGDTLLPHRDVDLKPGQTITLQF
jgi:tRNA A-37 threonylcarbamoyl transferase component Bud32